MMKTFESEHFTVELLAKGVYAAIHKKGGWAVGNAGIVDLGNRTLVFDTFLTPRAAKDLRKAAEEIAGRSVGLVVNSHYHNDHVWGNQVFDEETEVLSTVETRRLIMTRGMEEVEWYRENSSTLCDEMRAQMAEEVDEKKREVISAEITYYEATIESLPDLALRPPSLTFPEELVAHGKEFDIELISFKNSHTGSDTVLYIPSRDIVFMSDLLFVGSHPYLADGDPENLVMALDQIMDLNANIFVPGHGPIGKREDLEKMVVYVKECDRAVQEFIINGGTEDEISRIEFPDSFSTWELPHFFHINAKCMFQKKSKL